MSRRDFSFITLPNSLAFLLCLHAKISLSPTPAHYQDTASSSSSSLSVPVPADVCHGSSDISCLLSCNSLLVAVQRHIQQGLCNFTACCMTGCNTRECVCVYVPPVHRHTVQAAGQPAFLYTALHFVWCENTACSPLVRLPHYTYPRILHCSNSSSRQVNNTGWPVTQGSEHRLYIRRLRAMQLLLHRHSSPPVGSRKQWTTPNLCCWLHKWGPRVYFIFQIYFPTS